MAKDKIRLRKFEVADIPDLAILCDNRKIWENVKDVFPHPYTLKDAELYVDACRKENPQLTFAIEFRGKIAGSIGLVQQSDVYRLSAEVGFWVSEPYWGKGIASQALNLIIDYAFNELKIIRLFAGVFEHNTASMKVLENAGFKLDGIFVKSVIKNNKIINEHRYSIIKPGV